MTELLTSAQMRAVEKAAIDSGKVTGLTLMERAGQGVVDAILQEWPALTHGPHRAVVLCGPGNNGGDGFVVAWLLQEAGWSVSVYLYGEPEKLPPNAKANYERWCALGGVEPLAAASIYQGTRPDVIVDAIFGIGLTRPLPEEVAQALDWQAKSAWKGWTKIVTVAVDCPSGLDLDTGRVPNPFDHDTDVPDPQPAIVGSADLTVTFHTSKIGHYLALGPMLCKRLQVADIGLGGVDVERTMPGLRPDRERVRLTAPFLAGKPLSKKVWPASLIRKSCVGGHKFDHGHVVVFAGGVGRGGAARLAARAALRAGAGLVTVLCPPAALIENACQLDAIMLRSLGKDQALGTVIDSRATAFCLGPGMGVSELTKNRVIDVLSRRIGGSAWRDPAVVLDADALSSFAQDPDALFQHTHVRTILTPHEGEFGRLFADLSEANRGQMSKVDAVRQAAARAGCIVLLKGQDTVIAGPDGGAIVHAAAYGREAPWLATAGAGDVLAGLIAGLAASPVSADLIVMAEVATYLHVEAAHSFGPGLIAEDLPEQLPKVFRDLGL